MIKLILFLTSYQDGQFGDLFVTYEVKIPTHLTEKQKELFRELQNS